MSTPWRAKQITPRSAAGREAKRIFGPDVEWAAHPDPMTGEDWDDMARHIVEAAKTEEEPGLAHERQFTGDEWRDPQ